MVTLTFVRYEDSFNTAPTAPNLTPAPNFDAVVPVTFTWTFEDPDPGDGQSAYQLQAVRVSDDVTIVDTGKVVTSDEEHTFAANDFVNGVEYRWRVKTWDALDAEGPYSGYDFFEPTESPFGTIDSPEQDQQIDVADVLVAWTQTGGAAQDSYRVRVIDEDTSVEVYNSGFVTSTATSHLVEDLPGDDRTFRFEVTLRADSIEGPPFSVVAFVEYAQVDKPNLVVVARTLYVEVGIDNPLPTGDRPEVVSNEVWRREVGKGDWKRIAVGLPPNSTYEDRSAGAKRNYEYFVRARS